MGGIYVKYELRELKLKDALLLTKAADNKNVSKFLRAKFPYPYTLKDAQEYINYSINNKNELILGIAIDESICGCISAVFRNDVYKKSCELGYWLAEEYWGKGIMTMVAKKFCNFIFENYDIVRIDAEIFADNICSKRVLEKIGFEFEGLHKKKVYKDGRFMDAATYALIKK